MTALVLVFLACASDRCAEVQIPWDGSLQTCMLFGEHAAAQWTNEHPGWAVTRGWRCESGERRTA